MKKIYIYQRVLTHYRIPFFQKLAKELASNDLQLQVVYGKEYNGTIPKTVEVKEEWAIYRKNYYIKTKKIELVFQVPVIDSMIGRSIIITEQANRYLLNYIFLLLSLIGVKKIAFWGHGRNLQSQNKNNMRERFKKLYSTIPSWWFCYTDSGKEFVSNLGFDKNRITVVNNTIDTNPLIENLSTIKQADLTAVKKELNLRSKNIAIYCGGMYKEKRIDFLLNACLRIRETLIDFEIIFIGDGPEKHKVDDFCGKNKWAKTVGSKTGRDTVKYFANARCQLMPGAVGLAVIDSFALGVPLITTANDTHGPEADYIQSGKNGVISENTINSLVADVISIFSSDEYHKRLVRGCQQSIKNLSIDNMVANYAHGIISILN